MTTLCYADYVRDREASKKLPVKHTCGPDDGSNEGPWLAAPAHSIDGPDKRVLRAAVGLALNDEPKEAK